MVSKKLVNTVNIGIATTKDIKKEVKYQMFRFLSIKTNWIDIVFFGEAQLFREFKCPQIRRPSYGHKL